MRRFFALLTSILVWAGPSLASAAEDASPLLSLETAQANRGWEAVGRLNFGTSAYCTGALIAEDMVLTAAHCLFDKSTGKAFDTDQIEFLAGWRNGRASAYRGISQAVAHPDFTYSTEDKISRVAHDLALLRLDRPIRNPSMTPYEVDARPAKGATVGVVSYARDRSEAASLQEACNVMARQAGVLVLSCAVDLGASGSPIFLIEENRRPRIVSVISAMAKVREKDVALGTALNRPLTLLQEMMASQAEEKNTPPQIVSRNQPAISALPTFGTAGSGGAKFLKPTN